jgi:hypothetical protein
MSKVKRYIYDPYDFLSLSLSLYFKYLIAFFIAL